MGFFSDVGKFFSNAGKAVTKVVNSTPILKVPARAISAPVQLTRDIVTGKNVGDALVKRSAQTLSGLTPGASFVASRITNTQPGRNLLAVTDGLTAGTTSQLLAAPSTLNKVGAGKDVSNAEIMSSFKDTGIGAAKVAAAYFTFGAASGAASGLGAGSTLSTGAGIFGASKGVGVADKIFSGKATGKDYAEAVSIFAGGGDFSGVAALGSDFLSGFKESSPPPSLDTGFLGYSDPYGASSGGEAPKAPKKEASILPFIAIAGLGAYLALGGKRA